MREGELVAGRWTLVRPLPSETELQRWEAHAVDGAAVEVVGPSPHAALRPGVTTEFALFAPPDEPAVLPVLATDTLGSTPVRVHPPTRGTLSGVRLSPADAVAIAGWLGPAILASGGAAHGELLPEDVAIDGNGVPRLAIVGFPRARSVARTAWARAPEGPSGPRSDLWGLGAMLVAAVTGREPERGSDPRAALSAVADEDARAVFSALLAPDPMDRVVPTPPPHPPVVAVPALVAPERPVGTVAAPAPATAIAVTTTQPEVFPRWAVLVPLERLNAAALETVAARAGSDPDAVRRAARRGEPWVVYGVDFEDDAQRLVKRLGAAGLPARYTFTTTPRVIQYLLIAVVSGVIGLVTGIVPFLIIAGGLVVMAAINFRAMWPMVEARRAWQDHVKAALPADAPESRIRALRGRIRETELAAPVKADLRGRIDTIELGLDAAREEARALIEAKADDTRMATAQAHRDRFVAELDAISRALALAEAEAAATALESAPRARIPAEQPAEPPRE
jgi:hypothetical protein